MGRFKDPTYYLLSPISWVPSAPGERSLPSVSVPIGFVTDLASIPRVFWSLLRPDGDYAYAAILHDYLYWSQKVPRSTADVIFARAMADFAVAKGTINAVYEGVKWGGESAWQENARLREQGERRLLKRWPEDPTISWSQWKRLDVFA